MDAKECIIYPIGVSGHNYLKKQENIYSHSQLLQNGNIQIIQCDIKEKWMKVFTKNQNNTNDSDWNEMDLNELRKGIVVDLDDNGNRWEGNCLSNDPFGYGCIYNSDNHLIYNGFVFEGMKVCYGSEYYEDIGLIEYIGDYYCNSRFGEGKKYDKKNELIYEGEWSNDNMKSRSELLIEDEFDDSLIDFSVDKLEITETSSTSLPISCFQFIYFPYLKEICITGTLFKNVVTFEISNCNELYCIKIGADSFTKGNYHSLSKDQIMSGYFCIKNCPHLKEISIEENSFKDYSEHFELNSRNRSSIMMIDLPELNIVSIGDYSFYHLQTMIIKSIEKEFLFNRLPFTYIIDC